MQGTLVWQYDAPKRYCPARVFSFYKKQRRMYAKSKDHLFLPGMRTGIVQMDGPVSRLQAMEYICRIDYIAKERQYW